MIAGANIVPRSVRSVIAISSAAVRATTNDVLAARAQAGAGRNEAEAAQPLGGNAVIGVDIDYEVLGKAGSMLMVSRQRNSGPWL